MTGIICFNVKQYMIKQYQLTELNGYRHVPADAAGALHAALGRYWNGESGGLQKVPALQKVERSIAYMEEHFNQPLQVATLAALANVSSSHFFALFKRQTGCPPMDYFTRLRMRHACRLLDTTTASVKEVAAALGYDDPFYFSRVFKSLSAVAPLHYRSLGFESRRTIQDLLQPKDQARNGDPLRQTGLGRLPANGSSTQTMSPSFNQQKTNPRT